MLLRALLTTVVIPGGLALAIAVLGRRWSSETSGHRRSIMLAVYVAQLAGSWSVVGRPQLVPLDASEWLLHISAIGIAAAIASKRFTRERSRLAIQFVSALVVSYLVLRPVLDHRWTGASGALAVLVAAGTLFVYWLALERAVERATPRIGGWIALVALVTASVAVGASGSLLLAQLVAAGTAGIGGVWLVALVRPAPVIALAPIAAVLGWAAVVLGVIYAAMPVAVAAMVLGIPGVAVLVQFGARKLLPRNKTVAIVVATLAMAAVADALAATAVAHDDAYGYR